MKHRFKRRKKQRGAGSATAGASMRAYHDGNRFYVQPPGCKILIPHATHADLATVNSARAAAGEPPISPDTLKAWGADVHALKRDDYRPAKVADRPGKCDDTYLAPNHRRVAPVHAARVRPAFLADCAVRHAGTRKDWNAMLHEAAASPMLHAVLAVALSSAMSAYVGFQTNAGVILHGKEANGRSTALQFGASVVGEPSRIVKPWSVARSNLRQLMDQSAGSVIVLNHAMVDTARPTRYGPVSNAVALNALLSGSVEASLLRPESARQHGWVVGSDEHPIDLLAGTPSNEAAAVLSRSLILSADEMPLPPEKQTAIEEAVSQNFGHIHRRFVRELQKIRPSTLAAGTLRREEAFRQRVDASFVALDPEITRITARLHVVLSFAVKKLGFPSNFSRPDELLRCLESHRTSSPSLQPYEQLLGFATRPEVLDLRRHQPPVLSDDEFHHAIFIRKVGKHIELCMTDRKLQALVAIPALFLRDSAVRRAYRPEGDHSTRQVIVRQHHDRDRLLCFILPWPAD